MCSDQLERALIYARALQHPSQQPPPPAATLQAADVSAAAGHTPQARDYLHATLEQARGAGLL